MHTMAPTREIILESAPLSPPFPANPLKWWRARSSWAHTSSRWQAVKAPECESGETRGLVFQQPLASNGESMSIIRAADWSNYSFHVDFKFTTHSIAPPEGGAILYFRFRNRRNHYSFHFCLSTRRVEFWKRVDGEWEKGGVGAVVNFEIGPWYQVEITTEGDQHRCYLEGVEVCVVKDDDLPAGAAGIGAKFCGASFRHLRMTEL